MIARLAAALGARLTAAADGPRPEPPLRCPACSGTTYVRRSPEGDAWRVDCGDCGWSR